MSQESEFFTLRNTDKFKCTSLRVMAAAQLDTLLQHATPGDTIHKCPDAVVHDISILKDHVAAQLQCGDFVKV